MKNFSKAALGKFGAALLTTLLVIIITQNFILPVEPLTRLEQKFVDYRFKQRGEIEFKDSADIIILEITQDSYDQIPAPFNSWPWPRHYFAKVIENLNEAGAKAIGIDIVMSNPDKYDEKNDSILYSTIRNSGNVVVAGKVDIVAENAAANRSGKILVQSTNEDYSNIFFGADSSIGIVQAVSDQDGVYRRYVPYVYSAVHNVKLPTFAYACLNKFFNQPSFNTAKRFDQKYVYQSVEIPIYKSGAALVNFYGASGTFPRVKFIDVLDDSEFSTVDEIDFETEINTWDDPDYGLKNSGIFENKIVLIGSTMPEDKDLIPVSFSTGSREGDNLMYGVEYHANAAQNYLDTNFIDTPSDSAMLILLMLLSFGFFYFTSIIKGIKQLNTALSEVGLIVLVVLSVFILFELSVYLFSSQRVLLPIVNPTIAILFGYVGSTVFEFFVERKKSTMMKGMFSQYVSGSLVNELINNPDKLKLGGEKKTLSILFSDIAGFTSFSENKTPEEVVAFINTFLDEMTESVLQFNGTLDKYLGDSVMAFWGAPLDIYDHAELACKCALDMKKKLEKLNEQWSDDERQINMRIGINTGEVVVGNIGGKNRFDYTVMGDNVNLASRLEGANKIYGTSIMLSEETNDVVKSKFFTRELDTVRVKGKEKPTKIFELIGLRKEGEEKSFSNYYEGLNFYKAGNFLEAIKKFENQICQEFDPVSQAYIARCKELIANPPKEQWKGITKLTEK